MLVVQAAALLPGTSGGEGSSGLDFHLSRALQAPEPLISRAQAVRPTSRVAGPPAPPIALPQGGGRHPWLTAADKLQLTEAEAKDIARRLRTPRAPEPRHPVLRIFRYGIDDLRLFKAIDAADLEGRVVVVDTMDFADAVITTVKKRTGKNVNQAVARRAAVAAGVPCFVLKAVSAERLVEALGSMLDDQQGTAPATRNNMKEDALHQQQAGQSAVEGASTFDTGPRLLRQDEVETVGSQKLMQLMWGPAVRQEVPDPVVELSGSGNSASSSISTSKSNSNSNSNSGSTCMGVRWRAWHACQTAEAVQGMFEAVRATDIEDTRKEMLPANPNARAGERHKLLKPLRHRSKLQRKQLQKQLAEAQADW